MTSTIRLTQFSHGAGCGCKIAPAVLDTILKSDQPAALFPQLLVGNASKDDAAAYDLGNDQVLISTTDFFMPIVDDAFAFGKIAGANAISDVYAMGGQPILAIAILGWPVDKLPAELAQQVIEGARAICAEAGIPLAGGHSIDSPEPIFGLSVNGLAHKQQLKQNNTKALEIKPVVPVSVRNERNKTLRNLSYMKLQYFTQQHSGNTRPVLFEAFNKEGMMEGYTDNYIRVSTPYRAEWANQIVNWKL